MLRTLPLVFWRPLRLLDRLAVRPPRVRLLLWVSSLPISLLISAGMLLFLEAERPAPGGGTVAWHPGGLALSLLVGVLISPVIALALFALTWVEARGLVLFSAQHGTRIHRELAHSITRHGAAGWLLCGLGAAMALPLAWSMELGWRHELGEPRSWTIALAIGGGLLALVGFLWFECFAWLGLRRCRFANRSPR